MSWNNSYRYNSYTSGKSEAWHLDGGGNDEYTLQYCPECEQRTEHDVCTGECVECC